MKNSSSFKSDIESYAERATAAIKNIDVDIFDYNSISVCEKMVDWSVIYSNMGICNMDVKLKDNVLFFKILYCLITNSVYIEDDKMKHTDCYNYDLLKTVRVRVIDKKDNVIQVRKTKDYDMIVVIDCTNMEKYKIYEVENDLICDLVNTKTCNFYDFIDEYKLEPSFVSSINNLLSDYKKMAVNISNSEDSAVLIEKYSASINEIMGRIDIIEKKISLKCKKNN